MDPETLLAKFPTVRQAIAFVEFYGLVNTLSWMVRQGDSLEKVVALNSVRLDNCFVGYKPWG
jgi:hypothetical protein